MNNIIYTEPNLLLESYCVLTQLANPDASFNIRKNISNISCMTPEKEVIYKKLIHYFNTIDAQLDLPQDRINFFFKQGSNVFSTDSKGHAFLKICLESPDLAQLLTHTKHELTQNRFGFLRSFFINTIVSTPEELATSKQLISQESDLFEAIFSNTEFSDAEKYELFYLYYHYDLLFEEFIGLIEATTHVIAPLLEAFYKEVAALTETILPPLESKGMDYFNELCNVNLGKENTYKVYPCISNSLGIDFTNIQTSLNQFYVFFGIYVLPIMNMNAQCGPKDKDIADFLKALADPSKLQILKILKTERLYASQLAEKLGVSNATISHHMNALLQLQVIKYEKEHNRFYYSLEKENLDKYLQHLNHIFTL